MTTLTPQSSRLWLNKLICHSADQLTTQEGEARSTLLTCCLVLAPFDPPSPGGYSPRIIDKFYSRWLAGLPQFNSVARLEVYSDPSDTRRASVHRLWLLPDWLDSEEQRAARAKYSADQSRQWIELRYRFWRMRERMLARGMTKVATQELLEQWWLGYQEKFEDQVPILNMLGFAEPVTQTDLTQFEKEFRLKAGHTYFTPIDFTQAEEEKEP